MTEFSKRDLGIIETEVCPNCKRTSIDFEPAYTDGEITGTLVNCVECDWYETFEEDSPEDAEEAYQVVQKDLIVIDALIGWIEGFREAAVQEMRETDDEEVEQENRGQVEMADQIIDFFRETEFKTKSGEEE